MNTEKPRVCRPYDEAVSALRSWCSSDWGHPKAATHIPGKPNKTPLNRVTAATPLLCQKNSAPFTPFKRWSVTRAGRIWR